MHILQGLENRGELGAAHFTVKVLAESLEIDVGRIHVFIKLDTGFWADVSGGNRDTTHATRASRIGDVDRIFHEDSWIVVCVRDACASEALGRSGQLGRSCLIRESIHFPGLAHVPVLTELAGQVAAGRAKRKDGASGQKMVERLFLDRVDAEAARTAIGEEFDTTGFGAANEAKSSLAVVHTTSPRTDVALHATVRQGVPVARCNDSFRDVLFRMTQDLTVRRMARNDAVEGLSPRTHYRDVDECFNMMRGGSMKADGFESNVRAAAVAGLFYPESPQDLRDAVKTYLDGPRVAVGGPGASYMPKALIVPHAGFIYSGPIAGTAYASLESGSRALRRVVLLGPSHHTWFSGLAIPSVEAFETPLGIVPLDQAALGQLRGLPEVVVSDEPHALEHSLEVQLPFIQLMAPEAKLVPIVAGQATPAAVDAALELLWGGDETLIVASSDLSHYSSYATAQTSDAATAQAILNCREDLQGHQACGCVVINGLARAIRKRGLRAELLDLRNSGDTAGDKRRVVGYGAFGFYDA